MGKVYDNEPSTKVFEVYNQGDDKLTFLDNVEASDYIKVEFNPQSLGAKQKGQISITYDSRAKNDLGFSSEQVVFYTDEPGSESRKVYTIYADLNEYFEPLTPETAALAPKLNIQERIHDFGKITQGEVVSTTFKLENTGKSSLNIRKVTSNCTCAITEVNEKDIEPGESVELQVTFDTKGRRGTQQKSITIFSSDPVSPVQRVILKASIQVTNN